MGSVVLIGANLYHMAARAPISTKRLFEQYELACQALFPDIQHVEVHTARDCISDIVPACPDNAARTRSLNFVHQRANQPAGRVEDVEFDAACGGEIVSNGGLGVEWVGHIRVQR